MDRRSQGHSRSDRRPAPKGRASGRRAPAGRNRTPASDISPDIPQVIHEDEDVLVVNKPAGMPVSLRAGGERRVRTLTDWVQARARRASQRGERPRFKAANTLDPGASGLVVYARDEESFEDLRAQFRSRRVQRIATAIVRGHPRLEGPQACALKGTIRKAIERRGPRRGPDRLGVTHFKLLRAWDKGCMLRLRLETDHAGQAPDHLRAIGCPIQTARRRDGAGIMHLHLGEIAFTHPKGKVRLRFSAEPPAWFERPLSHGVNRNDAHENERDQGWEHVADWYDDLVSRRRSDHFEQVVWPGTLALLGDVRGHRVLDIACGQGELAQLIAERGGEVIGVDASPSLIEAAQARPGLKTRFIVGDVRALGDLEIGSVDAAVCVLALMNIDRIDAVLQGAASLLRPGGRLVCVILHPAFRQPGRTGWAWTREGDVQVQERRVRAYLSEQAHEVVMNPGAVSSGEPPITTTTWNRPLERYVGAATDAGLVIDAIEEWASMRTSEPGPRAEAENLARREIPMFLAFRAIRPDTGRSGADDQGQPAAN